MLQLHSFHLKEYGLWRAVDFSFKPGITLVTGANRSGKTLLFRGLKQALRAKHERTNSSLSRLPEKSSITVRLSKDNQPWQVRLTPTLLALNEGGRDQGSTGKKAPREMLARVLNIPPALFDSTIHVSGLGSHPLIEGTPGTRLAWVSAVLDLVRTYDDVALRVDRDLKVAQRAAAQADALIEEFNALAPPADLQDLADLRAKLDRARRISERYGRAADLLARLDELGDPPPTPDATNALVRLDARLVELRREHTAALAYEAEFERATTVRDLRTQLDRLRRVPFSTAVLERLRDLLATAHRETERLHAEWQGTADDRARLAELKRQLADAPGDLDAARERATVDEASNRQRLLRLSHAEGPNCPVCNARLDVERRSVLMAESGLLARQARERVAVLDRWLDLRDEAERLAPADRVVRPARIGRAVVDHTAALLRNAREREEVIRRLADLRPSGIAVDPPARTARDIARILADTEAQREAAARTLDRAERADRLHDALAASLPAAAAKLDIRDVAERAAARVDELIGAVAAAEAEHREAATARENRARLDARITALEAECEHLAELQALRAAMGRRGLRLTKVRDLVDAFTAEFNALAPLLWNDPFVIDGEVTESGLDVYASRRGQRSDLHSLSGSEVKGFKMLSALALIHLLPARLRADTIILDELEANMDDTVRRRFAEEFLPVLGKSIAKVVVVSPLTYQDVALPFVARYRVEVHGTWSKLVEA